MAIQRCTVATFYFIMCKSPSRQLVQSKEHTLLLDCCFFVTEKSQSQVLEGSKETEKLGDFTHYCQDFGLLELEFAGAKNLRVVSYPDGPMVKDDGCQKLSKLTLEGCDVAPGRTDFETSSLHWETQTSTRVRNIQCMVQSSAAK